MGIQWTTILELIVHNRQTRIPLGAITGYLPAARDKLGYRALDAAVDCCGSDVSGRDFCTHRVHMALLAHLALAFSVPLLPHPRHSPAVPAGCRAGRPALGPRPAAPLGRTQVIAYHKPAGLIVTHNDELDRPTVYEHLAQQPGFPEGRWDAVGRLDLNTSGLLLLTNDGWLLRHVTDPTSGTTRLPKTYRVLASKVLGEAVLERLRSGVELGGVAALVVEVVVALRVRAELRVRGVERAEHERSGWIHTSNVLEIGPGDLWQNRRSFMAKYMANPYGKYGNTDTNDFDLK